MTYAGGQHPVEQPAPGWPGRADDAKHWPCGCGGTDEWIEIELRLTLAMGLGSASAGCAQLVGRHAGEDGGGLGSASAGCARLVERRAWEDDASLGSASAGRARLVGRGAGEDGGEGHHPTEDNI